MAFSQTCKILWGTGMFFVILPHFSLGLLSDYKICGDTECESLLSRAQATRDHRGKDCRFLSFRRGEIIFVYQKLTGKREDLWAGSINKQFGYFSKEAVQEEQVYATLEKVVETQKSDFFCIDESGYLIDSSHLDDDADNDQKNQVSETTQTSTVSRDTSAESTSTSPVSVEDTPAKEEKSKSAGDAASRTDEGARETPAAPGDQGGSAPSSSWLGSSVTGWLGLAEEDEAGSLAEGGKTEEPTENGADASAASSVTEWLGLGGERKPDDVLKSREANTEMADSFTGTITGWLGFGGETKTVDKGQDDEREDDKEQAERFRSRRMSLDLEGSQLHEEEKKETGTSGWLGSGLSSTLGFGLTSQDSELKSTPEREAIETDQEEEEQLAPGSWFDMGIKDMLGFGEDKKGVDESAESGFKETEENKTFGHLTDSENLDISQSQRALTGEAGSETSNESKVGETTQDQNVQSEIRVHAENNHVGSSDTKKRVSTEDAATMVDLEDVSPQTALDKPFQTEGGLSLMLKSSKEKEEDNVSENRKTTKKSTELRLIENKAEAEGNNREAGGDESKTASGNNQDVYTQSGTNVESDSSSLVLNLNSEGQSVDNVEDITGDAVEEGDENPIPTADDRAEQRQVRGASGGEIRPLLSSGAVEESHEPVSNEDGPLLAHSVGDNNDSLDSLAVIDSPETETLLGETGEAGEEGSSQQFGLLRSTNKSKDISYENALEDRRKLSTNGSAIQIENTSAVQESVSPHLPQQAIQSVGDEHKLEKTIPETQSISGEKKRQPVQSETIESEIYNLNESGLKSAMFSRKETQTEKVRSKEEEKEKSEELKGEGKQQKVKEIKEYDKEKEGQKIKEEEKKEEAKETREEKNPEEGNKIEEEEKQKEEKKTMEEETQDEVKETKEEKKQEEEKMIKEEEKEKEQKEARQAEEEKNPEEGTKIEEEEKQKEEKKTMEEETQDEVKETKEEKSWAEKDHLNREGEKDEMGEREEEKKQEVSRRAEEQGDVKELKLEGKQQETEEFKEEREVEDIEEQARDKEKVMAKIKEEEVKEMENMEEEEEGIVKCSKELCSEASNDGFVQDSDENYSANMLNSLKEGRVATGQQNPVADNDETLVDRTGASQPVPVEGVENDEDVIQVKKEKGENKDDGAMADEEKNNDLPHSGESTKPLSLGQTTQNTKYDERLSSEAHNTELQYTETISNGVSAVKKTEQVLSDHKIVTEVHTDREENVKHGDSRTDGVEEVPVLSEETGLSDGHNVGTSRETPSGGAFGLFKSTIIFGSPVTKTEGAPSLGSNTGEPTDEQAPPPPEQEVDTTHDSNQVYGQHLHSDSPVTVSLPRPSPSPTQTPSHPVESPLQTKTPNKHNKSLLGHMSAEEATILTDLFGRHKLQFLDYTLGGAGTEANHPDGDDAILMDIERLLGHYREALLAPSIGLADAPLEDTEKTRTLIALQKLETLLARVRETFSTARDSSVRESYPTHSKTPAEEVPPGSLDRKAPRDEWIGEDKDKDGSLSGNTAKPRLTGDERRREERERRESERRPSEPRPPIQPASPHPPKGVIRQIVEFAHQIASYTHATRELLIWLTSQHCLVDKNTEPQVQRHFVCRKLSLAQFNQVVSSLPDDIRPGPDLYGLSWEPVIVSSLVGLVTMLLFTCRCYSSVKSRMYRSKERRMAEQVAQLLDEKCKVLEDLSKCQQEYDGLESTLKETGVLAQTQKTEHLEVKARQLGHAKRELDRDLEQLKDQLDRQREQRIEQERKIALLEETIKTSEEETRDLLSQDEQAQTTLKVYSMNSNRLQEKLETAGEEKALLQESNAQLRQEVEGWAERVSELEAEMSRCEVAHGAMLQDVATKDERIMSLTDRLLGMKAWDSDMEEGEGEAGGQKETSNGRAEANGKAEVKDTQGHLQKVQKLIYAAKLNADLKAVDEDKDRLFAKLNDEVKAKEELQESIREMDNEKLSLQSDSEQYQDQVQRLQQKLQIMTDMYQENELKLHRLLTVEEKERLQKEEKLNKADKNIALAMEELSNYRQRAAEMEEELEKTKQSYQTQISAHEKKAHNNWLAARAAERDLADIRRENSLFRQKLTDTQFKLDALDKDPYALDSLARPLPFRAERSPYGPSPLGRPASETRAFLSPPTLMDGPPARLSPRGGQGEQEQSGGPHSDSGSISPTWERDRRGPPPGPSGPLGPPGYMFPESGGPMYRRPPVGPLGPLHHPGPLHPRGLPPVPPHPADMADGSFKDGPGDLEHRESGPGDRRTPPEADPRIGGAPPPGHQMGPVGGPFLRRGPYGPPPPDFYPTRGPPGPPMMPMWAPPPPGMMFPPRFPPGGPNAPRPYYTPTMRPPLLDGHPYPSMGPLPPQQAAPSLSHSQSPEEHTPPPEDVI